MFASGSATVLHSKSLALLELWAVQCRSLDTSQVFSVRGVLETLVIEQEGRT